MQEQVELSVMRQGTSRDEIEYSLYNTNKTSLNYTNGCTAISSTLLRQCLNKQLVHTRHLLMDQFYLPAPAFILLTKDVQNSMN